MAAAAAQLLKVVVKRIARQKPVASLRPPSSGDEFESEAESSEEREGS